MLQRQVVAAKQHFWELLWPLERFQKFLKLLRSADRASLCSHSPAGIAERSGACGTWLGSGCTCSTRSCGAIVTLHAIQ
jgi:hypothetical protein